MTEKFDNPYLQSKALWNDLYGSVEERLKVAYRLIVIMAISLGVCSIGLMVLASHSPIQPYVTVVHGNELVSLTRFDQPGLDTFKPKLATLLVRDFIQKARGVSLDQKINQQHFIDALSMTSGPATPVLKIFHATLLPNVLIETEITSLIVESQHGMHVRWQEVKRDAKSGEIVATEQYSAELTFQFGVASENSRIAEHNPLGFYITSLAWSQDHVA